MDGITELIVREELATFYVDADAVLPALDVSFRDYAISSIDIVNRSTDLRLFRIW